MSFRPPPDHGAQRRAPPDPPAAAAPTAADTVVHRLLAAQRVHAMYPAGNPNVAAALRRLREALATFAPGEGLVLEVEKDRVLFGDLPVLANRLEVAAFAASLYVARVAAILLLPEVLDDELILFFDLLRLAPDVREKLGTLEEALRSRGVRHVLVRSAGRMRIEEEAEDPGAWDLSTLAELRDLESEVFGGLGRTEFREMLRAATSYRKIQGARLLGMLERPRALARYLVDLASRVRPRDRIDLGSQLAILRALVDKLEAVVAGVPSGDRAPLLGRLDQLVAWLSVALHKSLLTGSGPRCWPAPVRSSGCSPSACGTSICARRCRPAALPARRWPRSFSPGCAVWPPATASFAGCSTAPPSPPPSCRRPRAVSTPTGRPGFQPAIRRRPRRSCRRTTSIRGRPGRRRAR